MSTMFSIKCEYGFLAHARQVRGRYAPSKIEIDDILKQASNLNVFKSPRTDMLHPREVKEVRTEIANPLKLISDCSLATRALPKV